jgi:hypothetical protein
VLIELFGLVEVDLDGGQCRLAAGAVGDLDVDLGTVERNLSIGGLVRQPGAVEDVGQQGGGSLPPVRGGDVFPARPREGEPVAGRANAERGVRPLPAPRRRPGPGCRRCARRSAGSPVRGSVVRRVCLRLRSGTCLLARRCGATVIARWKPAPDPHHCGQPVPPREGRPTRPTPHRKATATRTERTQIRPQFTGNGVPHDRAVGQPVRQPGADQRVGVEHPSSRPSLR